ncbi:MAG: transcription termination/antitermination protein NusA [Ruminococcaceae bacterium]|nr:transcription termination/antitermination protein NusA [Oscillospiraceae bacterium]
MSKEFFAALEQFELERGIPQDYMIERISAAITAALKGSNEGNDNVVVNISAATNTFAVFLNKRVSDDVTRPTHEISLEDAMQYDRTVQVGDYVGIPQDPREFGRIAAQTARQVIRQGIREVERSQVVSEMRSREMDLVTGTVDRIDDRNGSVIVKIDRFEIPLTKNEQIEGEVLREGESVKVFVVEIREGDRSPRITISRTHPGLVKRLFETEVPEIFDGTVEIKAVAREAGSRTKLAVASNDENVDAVGACIGLHRSRISPIIKELNDEKIDIIPYSYDPEVFISNALAPAHVIRVVIDEDNPQACRVCVPDNELSLAIGHKGQNARLAARLTGFKIDIRSQSTFDDEEDEIDEITAEEEITPAEDLDTAEAE